VSRAAKDGKRLKGGNARVRFGIIVKPEERDTLIGGSYYFPSARSAEEVGQVVPLPESSPLLGSALGEGW